MAIPHDSIDHLSHDPYGLIRPPQDVMVDSFTTSTNQIEELKAEIKAKEKALTEAYLTIESKEAKVNYYKEALSKLLDL